jgi:hypothetical protein
MKRGIFLTAIAALAVALPSAASADLPTVPSGHEPGPAALYAPPASEVPQLENAGPWRAEPILVSGTQAYRGGEWLYQDFLHDDHGASGARDPNDPFGPEAHLFSPTAGSMTYPTDPVYAHNAADLVELRIRPLAGETAFRVTLNTLKDAERTGFTIALGSSSLPRPWPHGAGVLSPAELFLTVHGSTAELRDAASGEVKAGGATASVDLRRRQVDVRVPHAVWNPGSGKVRVSIGVGLWDRGAGSYMKPGAQASAERPGGAAPSTAALFNVGPRFDEPHPRPSEFGAGYTIGDAAAGAAVQAAWWRERVQADALRVGDVTPLATEVDFAKLAARTDDESGVPKTGPMNRILASRHQFGQGIEPSRVCYDLAASFAAGAKCEGRFVGQLQPYAIYVPKGPEPKRGYGLTLLLHSLSANYNQYSSSKNQSQFGERGPGSIVVTPSGRGPDGFYAGIAEADTFEVWADVAHLYDLDPDWAAVSGYSMGGFGTFRLLARWPDLFGRGMSTVGAPGSVSDQLASLRNTPIMTWNAAGDELVNIRTSEQMVSDMQAAGIRFIHDLFPTADHLTLSTNDEYGGAAEFLGEHRANRSPAHVTYVVDPREDSASARAVADHAYWLSRLRVRDTKASPTGTIDVRSAGVGIGDAEIQPLRQSAGAVDGGSHGAMPYQRRERHPGATPKLARSAKLFVKARNIGSATIDPVRSRGGCAPKLYVESDGPLELGFDPCQAALASSQPRCKRTVTLTLPRVAGRPNVEVTVNRKRALVRRVTGARIVRVTFPRPTRKSLTLTFTARAGGAGPPITLRGAHRLDACAR